MIGDPPSTIQEYLGKWFTFDEDRLPDDWRARFVITWEKYVLARRQFRAIQNELDDILVDCKRYME